MKKTQADLENAIAHIADSKTSNHPGRARRSPQAGVQGRSDDQKLRPRAYLAELPRRINLVSL